MFPDRYFSKGYYPNRYWPIGDGVIPPTPPDILQGGGGYSYRSASDRHREEEYRRKNAEEKQQALQRIEDALAEAERQERLAEQQIALQDEINRLRMERAWLIRLIDDEEAMFVLLMARPFH